MLENKLAERNVSDKERESIWTELRIKKLQFEGIIAYKTEGAILRSKVKCYNEGEKIQNISIIWRSGTLIVKALGSFKVQMGRSYL